MYESFYGLTKKPFQLTPDPDMLYVSYGHKNALSYMEYGLLQGEGFVVMTGDIGAGKTTLIRSLLKQVNDDNTVVAASITAGNMDSQETLATIANAFGINIETKSKVVLIKKIRNMLNQYVAENRRMLLIVDEAQTLTPESLEELRILSNTEIEGKAAIQIFLVGQDELKATLLTTEFEHLRQRIIASCHLNSLNEEETRNYIMHRLQKSGWRNDPLIEDDVFSEIYRWSGGVPRRINFVCDRLLLHGFSSELHNLSKSDVEGVIHEVEIELAGNEANQLSSASLSINIADRNAQAELSAAVSNSEVVAKLSEISAILSDLLDTQRIQNQLLTELVKDKN